MLLFLSTSWGNERTLSFFGHHLNMGPSRASVIVVTWPSTIQEAVWTRYSFPRVQGLFTVSVSMSKSRVKLWRSVLTSPEISLKKFLENKWFQIDVKSVRSSNFMIFLELAIILFKKLFSSSKGWVTTKCFFFFF